MAVAAEVCSMMNRWVLLLLVLTTTSCAWAEVKRLETRRSTPVTCEVAPHWTAIAVNGNGGEHTDPMLENRGKVVLIALTAASSMHSLEQAEKLGALETYLHSIGMSDVVFILVNSATSQRHLEDLLLLNLTTIVVQETLEEPVWSKLGGRKDQIFVYDRCGRLTYAIPFPLSIIHPRQQLVESSVISTYLDDLCGERKCSYEQTNTSIEDSADTELLNTTHSELIDVLQTVNGTEQVTLEETDDGDLLLSLGNNTQEKYTDQVDQEDTNQNILESGSKKRKFLDHVLKEISEQENSGKVHKEKEVTSTTTQPSLLSGLWSLYHNVLKHTPWGSKEKNKDEHHVNSVRKFIVQESDDESTTSSPVTTPRPKVHVCNSTVMSACRAWPKKKLDHARLCCNLHSCNRSAQYLQKHCRHYPKQRCNKVEIILECCYNRGHDEQTKPQALASNDPKS